MQHAGGPPGFARGHFRELTILDIATLIASKVNAFYFLINVSNTMRRAGTVIVKMIRCNGHG